MVTGGGTLEFVLTDGDGQSDRPNGTVASPSCDVEPLTTDRRAESVPRASLKSLTSEQRGLHAAAVPCAELRWRDWAADGGNYTITEAGVYSLADRVLSAPPGGAPFLVVSDLDGTMVGDDATTLRFKQYWQTQAVSRGCRLVYSTGRTLVQYLELAQEKEGLLAQPDALISAVGTRVYNYDGAGEWEEDAMWTVRCPTPTPSFTRARGFQGERESIQPQTTSLAAGSPPSRTPALQSQHLPSRSGLLRAPCSRRAPSSVGGGCADGARRPMERAGGPRRVRFCGGAVR